MKRIEIWTLLLAVVLMAAITCDDSDSEQGEPDASAQADGSGQAADADVDDAGDQDGEDAGEEEDDSYPPPPYGITAGATVENMRFATLPCECVENCDGQPRQYVIECGAAEQWEFKDFFKSEDKVLVLYVGAGW